MSELRPYRLKAQVMGQTSPPGLQHAVINEVVGRSVADIGCGSGVSGYLLRTAWQFTGAWHQEQITRPTRLIGVDWSQSTIDALQEHNPYDELLLAGATGVPIADGSVDTAISIENLEHLLPSEVAPALCELARIAARKIVISTPAPWNVTNDPFLETELVEARSDPHTMGYDEFKTLVGWLHKSSVTPKQMTAAGFKSAVNRIRAPSVSYGAIVYTADPADVRVDDLGPVVGIPLAAYPVDDGSADWRDRYAELVEASKAMTTPRTPPIVRRVSVVGRAVREALRTR